MLNEIIKVSSEKEVLKRQLSEMTERVEVLEKATRQIELDNERLAFKVGQYHNQLLIPNNPHKNNSPNLLLTLVSSKQFNKNVFFEHFNLFYYLFVLVIQFSFRPVAKSGIVQIITNFGKYKLIRGNLCTLCEPTPPRLGLGLKFFPFQYPFSRIKKYWLTTRAMVFPNNLKALEPTKTITNLRCKRR